MQPRNFEQRLTVLEQQMQELRELPGRVERVESQILQLRTEMKDGFSAIRADLRAELHVETGLPTEFPDVRDALRSEIRQLREDIQNGVKESQSLSRALHVEMLRAVSALDALIHHEVVARLDRLLERRDPGHDSDVTS